MNFLYEIKRYTDAVIKEFKRQGAVDKAHAVDTWSLRITPEDRTVGLRYLKGFRAVRRYRGKYYFVEKQMKNPMYGYAVRAAMIFAIVVPAVFIGLFLFGYILSFF